MNTFSDDRDTDQNLGELILETILSSNIDSIIDLNFRENKSWFTNPSRSGNADLLVELISKQAGLQHIDLNANIFYSNTTLKILTMIADHPSTSIKLQTLNLYESANFEADETVDKLADILQSARSLKKCDISYHLGSRKINVQIEYANEEGMGSIVLSDRNTNEVIYTRETDKTEANQKIKIE